MTDTDRLAKIKRCLDGYSAKHLVDTARDDMLWLVAEVERLRALAVCGTCEGTSTGEECYCKGEHTARAEARGEHEAYRDEEAEANRLRGEVERLTAEVARLRDVRVVEVTGCADCIDAYGCPACVERAESPAGCPLRERPTLVRLGKP